MKTKTEDQRPNSWIRLIWCGWVGLGTYFPFNDRISPPPPLSPTVIKPETCNQNLKPVTKPEICNQTWNQIKTQTYTEDQYEDQDWRSETKHSSRLIWCGWWAKDHNGLVEDKIEVGVKRTRYPNWAKIQDLDLNSVCLDQCCGAGAGRSRSGSKNRHRVRLHHRWKIKF